MEYRRLGRSGLQVSALSFGSWLTFGNQIENKTAENLMAFAYDKGINFFDNAEVYANGKSEEVMGKILSKLKWPRDTYVVSSKVYWGGNLPNQQGLSRKHVTEACHAALQRLRVDYLDLYFCHRPDKNTPIEETVRTMNDLISQGKILYWGTSEWSAQEIQEAYGVARQYGLVPPTMEQPQYNMFHRERFENEYRKIFSEIGIGSTIWSPLDSGLLTGKYHERTPKGTRLSLKNAPMVKDRINDPIKHKKVAKLLDLADEMGTSLTLLSLAWCLKNPNVSTVILGASKLSQLKENVKAIEVLPLLDDTLNNKIEKILGNKPVPPRF